MIPRDLNDIATHRTARIGSITMHWVEAGAGPAVVLLHGFPEMWWSWRHQIRPLAEAGFRVVVPDQRGYADTDKQGPYDLQTLAGDICNLIDHLGVGGRARIVGHDWGGAVAWHLGATRHEHVERLAVLNCPHPALMRKRVFRPRQALRSWYMFMFQVPGLAEWLLTKDGAMNLLKLLKGNVVNKAHVSDEELQPFREAIQKPGAIEAMVGWYRAIPKQILNPPKFSRVTAPTLIVWGLQDGALSFDDLVPGTEAEAPNLKVVPVQGAGHFVQSDRPEIVNKALIDFLS